MNIGTGGLGKALEKILDQFGLKVAHTGGRELCLDHAKRASAKVDGGRRERLVHGHQEVAGSKNTPFIAQSSVNRFSERDSDVFNGVMLVNVQVPACLHAQVKPAVSR